MGPDNGEQLERNVASKDDVWQLETRDGFVQITGRLLGAATGQRPQHSHNAAGLITEPRGVARCAACRWSEIYIFKVRAGDGPPTSQYCVYTLGPSVVPGEKTFANVRWATSGHEVVELCTVRKGDRATPFLPAAHSRALAMAADLDGRIENAYVNRAVA